jgi:hypothetical protein
MNETYPRKGLFDYIFAIAIVNAIFAVIAAK